MELSGVRRSRARLPVARSQLTATMSVIGEAGSNSGVQGGDITNGSYEAASSCSSIPGRGNLKSRLIETIPESPKLTRLTKNLTTSFLEPLWAGPDNDKGGVKLQSLVLDGSISRVKKDDIKNVICVCQAGRFMVRLKLDLEEAKKVLEKERERLSRDEHSVHTLKAALQAKEMQLHEEEEAAAKRNISLNQMNSEIDEKNVQLMENLEKYEIKRKELEVKIDQTITLEVECKQIMRHCEDRQKLMDSKEQMCVAREKEAEELRRSCRDKEIALEEEKARFNEALSSFEAENKKFKEDANELSKEIMSIQRERAELEMRKQEELASIEQEKDRIQRLRQSVLDTQEEAERMLKEQQARKSDLDREKELLGEGKSVLASERYKFAMEKESAENKLNEDNATLIARNNRLTMDMESFENRKNYEFKYLEDEKEKAKTNIMMRMQKIEEDDAKLASLKESFQQEFETKRKELEDERENIRLLRKELNEEYELKKRENNAKQAELDAMSLSCKQTSTFQQTREAKLNNMEAQLKKELLKLQETQQFWIDKGNQIEKRENQLIEQEAVMEKLKMESNSLQSRLKKRDAAVTDREKVLNDTRTHLTTVENQLDVRRARLDEQEANLVRIRADLEAIDIEKNSLEAQKHQQKYLIEKGKEWMENQHKKFAAWQEALSLKEKELKVKKAEMEISEKLMKNRVIEDSPRMKGATLISKAESKDPASSPTSHSGESCGKPKQGKRKNNTSSGSGRSSQHSAEASDGHAKGLALTAPNTALNRASFSALHSEHKKVAASSLKASRASDQYEKRGKQSVGVSAAASSHTERTSSEIDGHVATHTHTQIQCLTSQGKLCANEKTEGALKTVSSSEVNDAKDGPFDKPLKPSELAQRGGGRWNLQGVEGRESSPKRRDVFGSSKRRSLSTSALLDGTTPHLTPPGNQGGERGVLHHSVGWVKGDYFLSRGKGGGGGGVQPRQQRMLGGSWWDASRNEKTSLHSVVGRSHIEEGSSSTKAAGGGGDMSNTHEHPLAPQSSASGPQVLIGERGEVEVAFPKNSNNYGHPLAHQREGGGVCASRPLEASGGPRQNTPKWRESLFNRKYPLWGESPEEGNWGGTSSYGRGCLSSSSLPAVLRRGEERLMGDEEHLIGGRVGANAPLNIHMFHPSSPSQGISTHHFTGGVGGLFQHEHFDGRDLPGYVNMEGGGPSSGRGEIPRLSDKQDISYGPPSEKPSMNRGDGGYSTGASSASTTKKQQLFDSRNPQAGLFAYQVDSFNAHTGVSPQPREKAGSIWGDLYARSADQSTGVCTASSEPPLSRHSIGEGIDIHEKDILFAHPVSSNTQISTEALLGESMASHNNVKGSAIQEVSSTPFPSLFSNSDSLSIFDKLPFASAPPTTLKRPPLHALATASSSSSCSLNDGISAMFAAKNEEALFAPQAPAEGMKHRERLPEPYSTSIPPPWIEDEGCAGGFSFFQKENGGFVSGFEDSSRRQPSNELGGDVQSAASTLLSTGSSQLLLNGWYPDGGGLPADSDAHLVEDTKPPLNGFIEGSTTTPLSADEQPANGQMSWWWSIKSGAAGGQTSSRSSIISDPLTPPNATNQRENLGPKSIASDSVCAEASSAFLRHRVGGHLSPLISFLPSSDLGDKGVTHENNTQLREVAEERSSRLGKEDGSELIPFFSAYASSSSAYPSSSSPTPNPPSSRRLSGEMSLSKDDKLRSYGDPTLHSHSFPSQRDNTHNTSLFDKSYQTRGGSISNTLQENEAHTYTQATTRYDIGLLGRNNDRAEDGRMEGVFATHRNPPSEKWGLRGVEEEESGILSGSKQVALHPFSLAHHHPFQAAIRGHTASYEGGVSHALSTSFLPRCSGAEEAPYDTPQPQRRSSSLLPEASPRGLVRYALEESSSSFGNPQLFCEVKYGGVERKPHTSVAATQEISTIRYNEGKNGQREAQQNPATIPPERQRVGGDDVLLEGEKLSKSHDQIDTRDPQVSSIRYYPRSPPSFTRSLSTTPPPDPLLIRENLNPFGKPFLGDEEEVAVDPLHPEMIKEVEKHSSAELSCANPHLSGGGWWQKPHMKGDEEDYSTPLPPKKEEGEGIAPLFSNLQPFAAEEREKYGGYSTSANQKGGVMNSISSQEVGGWWEYKPPPFGDAWGGGKLVSSETPWGEGGRSLRDDAALWPLPPHFSTKNGGKQAEGGEYIVEQAQMEESTFHEEVVGGRSSRLWGFATAHTATIGSSYATATTPMGSNKPSLILPSYNTSIIPNTSNSPLPPQGVVDSRFLTLSEDSETVQAGLPSFSPPPLSNPIEELRYFRGGSASRGERAEGGVYVHSLISPEVAETAFSPRNSPQVSHSSHPPFDLGGRMSSQDNRLVNNPSSSFSWEQTPNAQTRRNRDSIISNISVFNSAESDLGGSGDSSYFQFSSYGLGESLGG